MYYVRADEPTAFRSGSIPAAAAPEERISSIELRGSITVS
jgi:hypothetical protein